MAIESDQPTLLRLCWLIVQQWNAELAYTRAQYRVSYYRKLKAKLESSKKTSEKWADHSELTKKIESTRLTALKKQEELLNTKKRTRSQIAVAAKKLNAKFQYAEGKIASFYLPIESRGVTAWQHVDVEKIEEMSDQHEAQKVLNKALTTKGNVRES